MRLRLEYYGKTPKDREKLGPRHRLVVELFSHHPAERFLDVGCGDGRFTSLLGEVAGAKEVYGLEISAQGTELAKKAGVKAIQLDVDSGNLPFEDAFFDAAFCGEVIEHLYDPDHLLEEVYRVLKDGGLLVLSTPNLAWWVNRIALALGFYPYSISPSLRHPLGHMLELPLTERGYAVFSNAIRLFTVPVLTQLLTIHGFKIGGIKGIGGLIPASVPLFRALNVVDRVFSLLPSFSFRCVIWCFKKAAPAVGEK